MLAREHDHGEHDQGRALPLWWCRRGGRRPGIGGAVECRLGEERRGDRAGGGCRDLGLGRWQYGNTGADVAEGGIDAAGTTTGTEPVGAGFRTARGGPVGPVAQ